MKPRKPAPAVEENRVGTPFAVRAVVAGKNNERVLIQSFFFQGRQKLTNVQIEPGDHRCERSPGIFLRGIAADVGIGAIIGTFVRFFGKYSFIVLEDAVVGNQQFGVGGGYTAGKGKMVFSGRCF